MSSTPFNHPKAAIQAGGITLPELYEWHATENPDYNLFCYHDGEVLRGIPYSDTAQRIREVARYVLALTGDVQQPAQAIGILANVGVYASESSFSGVIDGA